jgi:prepilin-type N-terminal cleavage/methylation domain-containing protein
MTVAMRLVTGSERGFTLSEVILAMGVVAVGLVALASVIPVGTYAVHEGKQLSTATFLADQRLEQVGNAEWTRSPANDCVGISALPPTAPIVPLGATCTQGGVVLIAGTVLFPDEDATQINGFPGYSRIVRVTDCGQPPGCSGVTDANLRFVSVTVTYRPLTGRGASPTTKSATLTMLVTRD